MPFQLSKRNPKVMVYLDDTNTDTETLISTHQTTDDALKFIRLLNSMPLKGV